MTSIFPHVAGGRRRKENTVYAMLFDRGWAKVRYDNRTSTAQWKETPLRTRRIPDPIFDQTFDNIGIPSPLMSPEEHVDILRAREELRPPTPDLRIDTRTRRTAKQDEVRLASQEKPRYIGRGALPPGPPINLGRGGVNIPFVPRDVILVPRRTSSYSVASTSASATIDTNIEVPKKGKRAAIKRLLPKNIFKK